ncbi:MULTISPECIES: hypothetical protein [Muribaculaceae]|jgi:hypothetical protein|uniref:Uncharacterized protein n=1 Tax=Lepagella muris TaxID=3032870 RepID=A0AC61RGF1_9BACT|nr:MULTISPECIES: hypothetical protein [Muribaculaceae]TGY79980.1 hypothetical protein E5331_04110 [Lepagella muris]THG53218.1 hypothetical protein E5984_03880 [Bacteroidales bacterium]TKC64897.1 hypothetical protein E5359_001925 [Bacteroidales bacterium]
MATIATNLTLSKLIAKMREIAKETAESTYALSDALYDVQLIAENHEQTRKEAKWYIPSFYWCVRNNGTHILNTMVEAAKWSAQQEAEKENPRVYRISFEDGKYSITFVG